jgi:uncharacterized membrane protein YeaQ/YmgE (transglycosylase-associated protein family)
MFMNDVYWPFRLLFPVLAFHQLEEYILPGGFVKWMNSFVLKSKKKYSPINSRNSFVPNVIIAWPIFIYISIYPYENIWLTLGLTFSIIMSNAMAHIILSIKKGRYSPGLISSIILFIPLSAAAIYFSVKYNILYPSGWIYAIVTAIIIDCVVLIILSRIKKKALR